MGSRAIFEIGRRLKWVKEHDLAHGEFGKWVKSLGINNTSASHFMKVASELENSNLGTYPNLGAKALYLIATMPETERDQPQQLDSGEVKKPASSGGIWQRTPKRFGDYWGSA